VPVRAGAAAGSIDGTLWWRGRDDGAPVATYVAGGALVLGSLAFVVVVSRRRRRAAGAGAGAGGGGAKGEAW
jgi:hypothetical protein